MIITSIRICIIPSTNKIMITHITHILAIKQNDNDKDGNDNEDGNQTNVDGERKTRILHQTFPQNLNTTIFSEIF